MIRTFAAALVLVVGASVARWPSAGAGDSPAARSSATTTTISAPTSWDPAIEPIAEEVQRLRGLTFKHPVRVSFLDDAVFDGVLRDSYANLTKAERTQYRTQLEQFRGLGLVAGYADLDAIIDTPDTSSVLAFYDPETKAITVRGMTLDPVHRATIAHELTHALDDQRFDLRKLESARRSSQSAVRQDLVEGSAEHVADLYEVGMTQADRALLDEERATEAQQEATQEPGTGAVNAPDILSALTLAPYVLGPPMVDTILGTRRQSGLDATLRSPPSSDEPAFNVLVAAKPHARVKVQQPTLRAGEQRFGAADDLGPFGLYLVLASRIDAVTALHAADGWAGDSLVSFRKRGRSCLKVAIAGHTRDDSVRIENALRQYARAIPAASVAVSRRGPKEVLVAACDPGSSAEQPGPYALRALRQISLRNEAAAGALSAGTGLSAAKCASNRITDDPRFRALVAAESDPTDAQREAITTRYGQLVTSCLSGNSAGH